MATLTTIDPRLRQRRIAVRRAEGRRRLRVLVGFAVFVGVLAGGYALTRSALFDLDEVEVTGVFGSEAEEIRVATELDFGTPMLDLDLDAAVAQVIALPWVETATIDRSWLGSVSIDVVRRIPVALLPTGTGDGVVIDADGIAISRSSSSTVGDLPVITVTASGDLGTVQTFALPAVEMVQLVPADLRPWIETYGIDYDGNEAGELVLDLVGAATAELGHATDLEAKLDALRTVLARVDRTCISMIDLRVAELPSVFRDDTCVAGLGEVAA